MLKSPRIEFLAVGTELLSGKINTHVSFLADRLASIGLTLSRESTVPDTMEEMTGLFREA